MNYDTVILELLTRVQSLERSLKDLEGKESVMDGEAYQDILARLCRLEAALGQEGGENSRPDKSEKALSTLDTEQAQEKVVSFDFYFTKCA